MRIYRPFDREGARHTVFVQPGREFPVAEWLDEDGKPRLFPVQFLSGRAEVPDNLGQYMIDQGQAQRSPLILPPGV